MVPQRSRSADNRLSNNIGQVRRRPYMQCLKWSKKETGSLPQSEVECPSPEFLIFISDLKVASFDAFLVVSYAI